MHILTYFFLQIFMIFEAQSDSSKISTTFFKCQFPFNEILCVSSWVEIEMLRTYKVRKGSQPRQVDMTPSLGKGGSSSNELINLKKKPS